MRLSDLHLRRVVSGGPGLTLWSPIRVPARYKVKEEKLSSLPHTVKRHYLSRAHMSPFRLIHVIAVRRHYILYHVRLLLVALPTFRQTYELVGRC